MSASPKPPAVAVGAGRSGTAPVPVEPTAPPAAVAPGTGATGPRLERLFTAAEVAEAVHFSTKHVEREARAGRITYTRGSHGKVLFTRAQVGAYIASLEVPVAGATADTAPGPVPADVAALQALGATDRSIRAHARRSRTA